MMRKTSGQERPFVRVPVSRILLAFFHQDPFWSTLLVRGHTGKKKDALKNN
jgi:hypothetical protein